MMLLPGAVKMPQFGGDGDHFLAVVATLFLETGRWPAVKDVERVFERRGEAVNARREAGRMCLSMGREDQGRIVLTVRAIHQVKPKNPALLGFKEALDLALVRFQSSDLEVEPTLDARDLARSSTAGDRADRVIALMIAEGLLMPSNGDDPPVITARVRRFRSVETIPEYIAEKSTGDRRRCLRHAVAARRRSLAGLLERPTVTAVLRSAAGILLAALVLWLGSVLFPVGERSDPPRPPSRGSGPQAQPSGPSIRLDRSRGAHSRRSAAARSGG